MILLDFSGTIHANIAAQIGFSGDVTVEEGLIRHMVLNTIRSYVATHRRQYGELVIALDGRHYWRREIYPFYKHRRRVDRKESTLDWPSIFEAVNKVADELKEFFPYRVVGVDRAEADDVIAVLAKRHAPNEVRDGEPILIISKDRDFIQLQRHPGIQQWDPLTKKLITHLDPMGQLMEKVIKGDPGDGVPNVLSGDDHFAIREKGQRQPSITAKRLEQFSRELPMGTGDTMTIRNYHRNRAMVDLDRIPSDVVKAIIEVYESQAGKNRTKIMGYMMEKRLRALQECVAEF